MKISKDTQARARRLLRLCLDEQSILREDTVRLIAARLLASKPRNYLPLLQAFSDLVKLEVKKHTAIIRSAVELTDSEKQEITARLQEKKAGLHFQWEVDPSLIAGFIVQVGDDRTDASVLSRLNRLSKLTKQY